MPIEVKNTLYTTPDRRMTFTFDFVQLPGGLWRIYIVRQPGYAGRLDGAIVSHRLNDPRGSYICWTTPIRTLNEAKGVARVWADATQTYIATGAFPPPAGQRHVPDRSSTAGAAWADQSGDIRPAGPPPTPAHHSPAPQSTVLRRLLDNWRS